MSTKDLASKLEALLFVSDEPVTATALADLVETDNDKVTEALSALQKDYEQSQRGFQLREVAGGWRMYSNPLHHTLIEDYILSWDTRKLSQAALEALAIVAYRQPVTRNGVNAVRGVNSEGVMGSLLEKGLIKDVGRDRTAGNAILYGTTVTFLEKFGLASLDDLPDLEQFMPQQEIADAIRDRLDSALPADVDPDADAEASDWQTDELGSEDSIDPSLETDIEIIE